LGEGEDDAADFVEAEAAGGAFFEGVDVDSVFQFGHGAGDDTGGLFEPVAFAGDEGLFVHPDDHGVDVGGDLGDGVGAFRFCVDEHVAAGDVDFVFEGDGDAHGGEGFVQFSVEGDNGFDGAGFSGGEDSYGVAFSDDSGGDGSGEAAEVGVGAEDELDGEAEITEISVAGDLDGFEVLEECFSAIPVHGGGWFDDIVAVEGAHGDEVDVAEAEGFCEGEVIFADFVEAGLGVLDEVHFIDGDDEVFDAEEGADVGVAFGLDLYAVAGVNEDDGEVAGGGAGSHVAGVLFMAGGVGDDEFAFIGGEVAVGDVDGDSLFAFGAEAVGEESEVDLAFAGSAVFDGIFFDGGELVFVDALCVVQQSAN